MVYTAVEFPNGMPVDGELLTEMSAAVAAHEAAYLGNKYSSEIKLTSTTATVTFTGIPASLRRLTLWVTARSTASALYVNCDIRIGGDNSAAYRHALRFIENGANSSTTAGAGTSARIGYITAANATAGTWGGIRLDMIGWNSPHVTGLKGVAQSGEYDGGSNFVIADSTIEYYGAALYTTLTVLPGSGSFASGSQFFVTGE